MGGPAQAPVFVGGLDDSGPIGMQTPTNVIEIRAGGLNYRDKLSRRAEIAASYFVNQGITITDQQSRRTSILPGRLLTTDQHTYSQNRQLTHRFNARLDWQLDSMTSLRITPSLSWQTNDYSSLLASRSTLPGLLEQPSQLVNSGETSYKSVGNSLNGNTNVLLMHKFRREGRTLSVNLNTVAGDGETKALNQSVNTFYDSTGTNPVPGLLNQQNQQTNSTLQNTLTLSYTEPLSFTQKLELRYTFSANSNQADRLVADQNDATKQYDRLNFPLSNQFTNLFSYHRAGATFQTQRLRYRVAVGVDLQQSQLQVDNRSAATNGRRQYINLLPNALFNYTFSGSRNLRLHYRTHLSAPLIAQLQPVLDNTNPLNLRVGNAQLAPEFYNTVVLSYNGATEQGDKSFFAFASLNQSPNRIAMSTAISPSGVQTTQPVNAGGFWSANGVNVHRQNAATFATGANFLHQRRVE